MDKFLKQVDRPKSHAANVSAAERAKQYKRLVVYEDGGSPTTLLPLQSARLYLQHWHRLTSVY